jgi:hypothetical protein
MHPYGYICLTCFAGILTHMCAMLLLLLLLWRCLCFEQISWVPS